MTKGWWIGLDWGSETHAMCVVDAHGQVRGTRAVAHTAEAVQDALAWLCVLTGAPPAAWAVAIETPRGVLVDTLLAQGVAVFALNPKQLDRFRDRFTAAGAKDDARDAHVLADSLRTDARAFRAVHGEDARVIELREVTRLRDDLLADEQRLANRLRETLARVDAAWLVVSPAADEPWLWALLAQVPDPTRWATLTRARIAALLRAHHIRRLTADEVRTHLQRPRLTVAPGVPAAVRTRLQALVPQLQLLHTQRLAAEHQIDQLLAQLAAPDGADAEPREHRDVAILQSLPGVGRMVTATMLTEATTAVATRDYSMLRAHAGAAPITKRSGKRLLHVQMRYACNSRLRAAVFHWSRTSLQHDPLARAYYDRLRARGHHHARALRSVGDRWLRILVALLKTRTLYDASRPRTLAPLPA